jgi:hypothetical protein
MIRCCGGFVVESVCWRHTTIVDGTWVFRLRAADGNVRTLVGARWSAPYPCRAFCNRCHISVLRSTMVVSRDCFESGGAEVIGGT